MVINLIVGLILAFAGLFWLIWFVRRDLREQIELPKHNFQDNVQRYDEQCKTDRMKEPEAHE